MKTQCEKVLQYMKQNGSITSMEAFSKLRITRLSARIYDLRQAGKRITQERRYKKTDDGATHYDVYRLEEAGD